MPEPTAAEPRDLEPIRNRDELPLVPLRRADIPAGVLLFVGRLIAYRTGQGAGRPLVGVRVWCPRCGHEHQHAWRWDWGLSPDVVSYVVARCQRGTRLPYAIGLSPSLEAENAKIHALAHEEYLSWRSEREARWARQKAEKAAKRAARLLQMAEEQ